MKKLLGVVLLAGAVLFCSSSSKPIEEPSLNRPAIRYAEVLSIDGETTDEETKTDSESSFTLEDADGDGIPDAIEDYYDAHIRDQYMFGISLGAIIGVVGSLVYWMYMAKKNNTTNKKLLDSNEKNSEIFSANDKANSDLKKLYEEFHKDYQSALDGNNEIVKKYEDMMQACLKSNEECTSKLQEYAKFDEMMRAIMACLKELGSTSDNVKEGVTEKINEIVNGVK